MFSYKVFSIMFFGFVIWCMISECVFVVIGGNIDCYFNGVFFGCIFRWVDISYFCIYS